MSHEISPKDASKDTGKPATDCKAPETNYRAKGRKSRLLTEGELVDNAESFAAKEFERLANEYGLGDLLKRERDPVTWPSLNAKIKAHKPVGSVVAAKIPKVGIALELAVWAGDVVQTFSKSSTAMEQAVVVSSIVPVVGCVVQTAEYGGKEDGPSTEEVIDSTLCIVGDVLSATPAWPVGLVAHSLRMTIGPVSDSIKNRAEYERLRNEDYFQRMRLSKWNQTWTSALNDFAEGGFVKNLEIQYRADQLAVIGLASGTAGRLYAGSLDTAETEERRQRYECMQKYTGWDKLRLQTCISIAQRKRSLAAEVEKEMLKLMLDQQKKFDDAYMTDQQGFFNTWRQREHPLLESIPPFPDLEDKTYLEHMAAKKPYPTALPQETVKKIREVLHGLAMPTTCAKMAESLGKLPQQASSEKAERLETIRKLLEWDPVAEESHRKSGKTGLAGSPGALTAADTSSSSPRGILLGRVGVVRVGHSRGATPHLIGWCAERVPVLCGNASYPKQHVSGGTYALAKERPGRRLQWAQSDD